MTAAVETKVSAPTRLTEELRASAGTSVRAVVLYGSHLSNARPDRHSAVDLLVIVDSYRAFYEALAENKRLKRSRHLMRLLSWVLPPNVISFTSESSSPALGKCLVLNASHFDKLIGPHSPDHFVICRMIQWVELIYAASDEEERWVRSRIEDARYDTLTWVAPYLREPVDAVGYSRRFMEVCFRGEVRPESRGRASTLTDAQADFMTQAYGAVLERAAAEGLLTEDGGLYSVATPIPRRVATRRIRYFRVSRVRACVRWMKHMVTFDDWFTYLTRKIERHTGEKLSLSRREREWPLIFAWPRVFAFFRSQSRRRVAEPFRARLFSRWQKGWRTR